MLVNKAGAYSSEALLSYSTLVLAPEKSHRAHLNCAKNGAKLVGFKEQKMIFLYFQNTIT
jgi:hypothetical protein